MINEFRNWLRLAKMVATPSSSAMKAIGPLIARFVMWSMKTPTMLECCAPC
jgi:hypothetical protein